MLSRKQVTVDIKLEIDEVTHKTLATMLTTTVECLAFHRNQIPFSYKTFKYMVQGINSTNSDETWTEHLKDRQKQLAVNTLDGLTAVLTNIKKLTELNDIDEAFILFGSTVHTPKEAFIIKVPEVNRNHSPLNHQKACQTVMKELTMTILGSEDFYDSTKPQATNMFVFLHPRDLSKYHKSDDFHREDEFNLPKNCKLIELNLEHLVKDKKSNNCCRDLLVFNEFNNISLSKSDQISDTDEKVLEEDCKNDWWYRSTVIVKGYKDSLIKGKSIWNL